jgi:hypothetical protein
VHPCDLPPDAESTQVEQEGEMEVENHRMTQEELEMQEKTAEEIDEVIANIKVSPFLVFTARC